MREYGDVRLLVELGERAEAAGWDGFFVRDHVAYRELGAAVGDPWVAVAALARSTRTRAPRRPGLRAGPPPAAKVARETASLDQLSGGRICFGARLGSQAETEFEAFGEDPDSRVRAARLDEGLEVLAALWSGEPVEHRGDRLTVHTAGFHPRPVQRPRIPIWIAGRWRRGRRFVARRWDGVFPFTTRSERPRR